MVKEAHRVTDLLNLPKSTSASRVGPEGGSGIPADEAFFAHLLVSLMHPDLQKDQTSLNEISELIRARLAARHADKG